MVQLFVIGLAIVGFVVLLRHAYRFKLIFARGALVATRGQIPPALRSRLSDVARHGGVSGTVTLFGQDHLRFSASIDAADRQRFRNAFFANG